MTNISIDEDITILEDWDHELNCTAVDNCEARADWSATKTCCGELYFWCEPCRSRDKRQWYGVEGSYFCSDCNADHRYVDDFWTNWVKL